MQHKLFNQLYPYTYYLRNNITGKKYHGVRWKNIRLGILPCSDLGITYFSSGRLKEDFEQYPDRYEFKLKWTFDTIHEAREYEAKINSVLMHRVDWENYCSAKAIFHDDVIRARISEAKRNIPQSFEHKQKLALIRKGKKFPNRKSPILTEEHKQNISRTNYNRGKILGPRAPEVGHKISAVLTGRALSEEHKKNISAGLFKHYAINTASV